jgi:hypothetical protein
MRCLLRHSNKPMRRNMQVRVITNMLWNGLDLATPMETTEAVPTALDKKLKTTVDSFVSFAEAPFKAEVVVYETAEDYLE